MKNCYTREQIEKTVESKGYKWFTDPNNKGYDVNIVGVRNSSTNNEITNKFDDCITVSYKVDGEWKFHCYGATTDPGKHWAENLLNKQTQTLADQLKLSKQLSKAEKESEKILAAKEKSFGAILGHLVKGNFQQAQEVAFGKQVLGTTQQRAKANEDILRSLGKNKLKKDRES